VIDKITGSLVGLAMGDALGQPTEGWSPQAIAAKWGYISGFVGEVAVSDDTEYTLYSAKLLLEHGYDLTRDDVADAWLRDIVPLPGPFKGAGFSELATIENLRRGIRPPDSGQHFHAWSDGFAMRVAPFAAVAPGDPQTACRLATEDGIVSHAGEGLYSGLAVAAAVSVALTDAPLNEVVHAALEAIPDSSWTARAIREGWALGSSHPSAKAAIYPLHDALAVTTYPWADLGPEAIGLAFGLLHAGRGEFEATVLAAVNLGRDADTIAAIVGAILGAKLGYDALPPAWRSAAGEVTGRCLPCVRGLNLIEVAAELTQLPNRCKP